jgi:DNA-binding transcriptional LysR family regulator
MDLWQLNIFCRVVERRSFSKAAETVHLSQPTVSSHIKDLESHFGCPLIDRLSKEAAPTPAGRLLYGYALRLLALREEIQTAMAQYQGKTLGRLVLGGSTIPGGYLLPRMIGLFKKRFPQVALSLVVADTKRIIAGVLEGSLEFGVVGAESRDRDIRQEALVSDEMRLIIPAGHPWASKKKISLTLLLTEPYIAREQGSGTLQSIQERLVRLGHDAGELNIVAEMGSTEAIRQGIREGLGVSILSMLAVSDDLASGRLKALTVEGLDLTRRFFITRHRQRSLSPLAGAFIDFLKETPPNASQGR